MKAPEDKFIIGIDEAGRGPLAGPVVVAGVAHRYGRRPVFLDCIKDSKKLTPKQREKWFRLLTGHHEIKWAVARVWPPVIDKINISQAANLGARRVCSRLSLGRPRLSLEHDRILLDGGLRLPRHLPHETIIKGDEKIP